MPTDDDRRRSLLVAALGFTLLAPGASGPRALGVLRRWLTTWTGIGLISAGMARQGYDLSLTRYDERGWRATFYVTGTEHSATGAVGSAFEPTPFRAVHAAAWLTLSRGPLR
jgi:hypothetical protein